MATCAVLQPSSASQPHGLSSRSSKVINIPSNEPRTQTRKPESRVPALPSEIWLNVFEIAAYIPGILAISDVQAIEAFSEDYNGVLLTCLYDDVLKAKLAISQVSWTWRKMNLPLLFEFVLIKSGRHAQKIAGVLARLKAEQSQEEYYGRWIKRVEVMSSDRHWDGESADALAGILMHTPNLAVFSDFFRHGSMFMDSCVRIAGILEDLSAKGQLRRIDSSGGIIYRPDLLSTMSSLEVFITSQAVVCPMEFPEQLHTLVIANSKYRVAELLRHSSAPNLRNLIMRGMTARSSLGQADSPHTEDSMGVAAGIRHFRWFTSFGHYELIDMERHRLTISDMPELTSLTMDFATTGLGPFETFRIKHPTLERINFVNFPVFGHRLYPNKHDNELNRLGRLLDFLLSLLEIEHNPSLRAIGFYRYLSWFESGHFNMHSKVPEGENFMVFSKFLDACKQRGVAVEASIGARNHFYGVWQPFHLGLVPRIFVDRIMPAKDSH